VRHLSEGTMRRAIDEPMALNGWDRAHLGECAQCTSRFEEIRENATFAAAAFGTPMPVGMTGRAFASVQGRIAADAGRAPSLGTRLAGWGSSRRRMVPAFGGMATAAVLVGAVALTPAGSLAQSFISLFQPQQVAPISLTTGELKSLLQLRHYGAVRPPESTQSESASTLAAAESDSGMHLLSPASLPSGVPASVTYRIVHGTTGSFTFSAAKARAWAAKRGKTLASVPAGVDGSTLTISTGNAVVALYGSESEGFPPLVIGQMPAPKISTTGVSVDAMENFILGLPGISPQLATQIRALGSPTSTLPLPIPVQLGSSQSVTVHGVQGYLVGDNTGLGSAVIWEQGGMIYGVGGTVPGTEAVAIANSLK
jgi:hypothetical protein